MKIKQHLSQGTPYDDAFRTLVTKGGNLVIPLLNELFPSDTPIRLDAPVVNLSNELFVEGEDGRQQKLVTDSYLHVGGKTYHVECQSYDDGDMVVRMVQYDMGIAMQESVHAGDTLNIHLPESGVLFLRKSAQTPSRLHVNLQTPGGNVSYDIPAMRLADYSLDNLTGKKLLFLVPFYLFNLEKEFKACEKGEISAQRQVEESLGKVIEFMNNSYQEKTCDTSQYLLVSDMLEKVTEHLTAGYRRLGKELDTIMGGKILEFKGEKLINEGLRKGRQEGRQEGRLEGRQEGRQVGRQEGRVIELAELARDGVLPLAQAQELAGKKYGIPAETFRKMVEEPETEQMEG